ncbi:ATP-binding domain-containing protein [Williamsia sp. CHRR-6]|uniref:ATP-binding domain-containing protein n=1 Tax=Williamsia sp. CHRR-6 TaxID=2835871 RepID=UPI001BD95561|nr:ATP-binding domain-containing protein [Williamsia sp. CHRR-6]MBT0565175.1 PhoH family protein [Williamsia sp. CHRR-6]
MIRGRENNAIATTAGDSEQTRLDAEQAHLDAVYGRLDRMRRTTNRRLQTALRESDGTPQSYSERESYERMYTDDLTKYDAAEHNLYFGRLDLIDGEVRRIGRIGILDDDDEDTTLLLDWRAPLSRPFYLATPASPDEVAVRRHIRTRNRRVTAVNDERLDIGDVDASTRGDVVNETALIGALNAARTGEMTDIVETIQREQDLIIRSSHRGVTVVQGGPGTGKTAVALHRAAYLLYTHRESLARSGVLILGPNDDFLRYIGQVLPSLGETGVLLSTIGNIFPGVRASHDDSRRSAEVKGQVRMADVLTDAVREYEALPTEQVSIRFDGYPLIIDRALVKKARGRARSSRRPHNQARPIFIRSALDSLAQQHARRIGASVIDGSQLLSAGDVADIREEMDGDATILAALAQFWPSLSPEQVLHDLLRSPDRIRSATAGWEAGDRDALLRSPGAPAGFSVSDIPLLDELAEIIGFDIRDDEQQAQARWRRQLSEAQEALDILTGSAPQDLEDEVDPEILMAYDLIDAEQLASRQLTREHLTTAERAYGDRSWAFGHVIVDEAQEISPMGWRMIMRRIPSRWMTIIGDTAQTGDPAGSTSWSEALAPFVASRWKLHELTVNYRTPAEVMAVAARVLHAIDPNLTAPTSIRRSGVDPVFREVDRDRLVDQVTTEVAALGSGREGITAVIAPVDLIDEVAAKVAHDVRVLRVAACKGLEFDRIVVVEPAAIVAASPRGLNDLYVALTRATQQLAVVHSAPLPDALIGPRST